jgi:hypothetical protein
MQIILWFLLPQLVILSVVVWLYRMPDHGAVPALLRSGWNRIGGPYHRLSHGKLWEAEETELYRARLLRVTAYTIDRHILVQGRATCIVTNRRIMLDDAHTRSIQILRDEIRAVRAGRTYDTVEGFTFWVAVERVGSNVHEPEGDVCLVCASQGASAALASAIEAIRANVPQP